MKPLLTLQGILELNALVCFSTQHVCFCFLFLLSDLLTVFFVNWVWQVKRVFLVRFELIRSGSVWCGSA